MSKTALILAAGLYLVAAIGASGAMRAVMLSYAVANVALSMQV